MKNENQIEIILFDKYSFVGPNQDKLLNWLTTTAQAVVDRQYAKIRKMYLIILEDTPGICMS